MAEFKAFDAFPKIDSQHAVRSQRGGFSTVFLMFFVLFIAYVEIGDWFDGQIYRTFSVDNQVEDTLTLNIDILMAMPCNFLHTNVLDLTNDRTLAADYLTFEGTNFFIPYTYSVNAQKEIKTPDIEEVLRDSQMAEFRQGLSQPNSGEPACHIYGRIPVSKLPGDFHITAKGYTYRDFTSHVPIESLNFSHVISEFSFGEFYPYLNNPLDFTAKVTENNLHTYQYFLSAVPTTYIQFGAEINTYQYGVTEQEDHFDKPQFGKSPGIFLKYDFESIKLTIEDKRIAFSTFVIRLVTICGGLVISFKWLYRFVDKLITIIFGKRFASRGQEKVPTFLDQ